MKIGPESGDLLFCASSIYTCSEGSGDYSTGVESSCSLEFDGVLCGLSQSLQSNPRVL